MSLVNLFSLSYWFSQPELATGVTKWILVLGFLGLVLAGLVIRILLNSQKEKFLKIIYRRVSNIGFVVGLSGLIWMFFRQENIFFLAWRFWIIFIVLVFVVWGLKVLKYIVKRVPEIKKENEKRKEMQKYMPGK